MTELFLNGSLAILMLLLLLLAATRTLGSKPKYRRPEEWTGQGDGWHTPGRRDWWKD